MDQHHSSGRIDPRFRTWCWIGVAALLACYAVLLFRNTSRVAGGPDESGYMNAARLFADGRMRIEVEPLRTLSLDSSWLPVFTPLGFHSVGEKWIVPAYPPGLSLHLIAGGFFVSPVLGLGCLLLTFVLARELGLSPAYALAAAVILAVTPQFLMFSLQVMSDLPATFWGLLSVWLALRGAESRARMAAAGAAFAIGVTVRPTNVLIAIPLLFAVGVRWRRLLELAAGALPIILALLWFQRAAYGHALRTGYGGIADVVSFDRFGGNLSFYSYWMARTLSPLVAPLGLFILLNRSVEWWIRALLASWFLLFLGFYSLWGHFEEWWYTRFLLPATPAIVIAAFLVIRDVVPLRWLRVALIVVMIAVPWTFASEQRVLRIDDHQKVYAGAMRWSAPLLPDDAMVVSGVLSGTFLLYQNRLTARWDELNSERFAILRERAKWYAVLSDQEVTMGEFERRLPGPWRAVSRYRDVTLYRLER